MALCNWCGLIRSWVMFIGGQQPFFHSQYTREGNPGNGLSRRHSPVWSTEGSRPSSDTHGGRARIRDARSPERAGSTLQHTRTRSRNTRTRSDAAATPNQLEPREWPRVARVGAFFYQFPCFKSDFFCAFICIILDKFSHVMPLLLILLTLLKQV